MKKIDYTVARHTFRLQMEAGSPLWECLGNYAPFQEETSGGTNPIFTLTVAESLPIETSRFTTLLTRGESTPDSMELQVHRGTEGHYLFDIKMPYNTIANGRLLVSPDFGIALLQLRGSSVEQITTLNRSLMLCYLLATATQNTLLMHASVIVNAGIGYLFMGKSGTGKSTHSSLWLKYISGSELMNDDNPVVRILDDKAWVFGSPWSGKTPCYRNISVPIGGFVHLQQAKENHIRQQNAIESYASLLTGSSGMTWETALADGKNRTLQQLVSTVPCWLLNCLPDEAAARLCAENTRKEESCKE